MAKRKTIISGTPLTKAQYETLRTKKLLQETKGKSGKALAKKIANVGKPKGKKSAGFKFVGVNQREIVDVYEPAYTPKQRKAIKRAKGQVTQMRSDRERTYNRVSAIARRESKKKK
jgi:hypothetical protein